MQLPAAGSGDSSIEVTDREQPAARGLYVGFRALSRVGVDAFCRRAPETTARLARDTIYGPDYYGGFPARPGRQQRGDDTTERKIPLPTAARPRGYRSGEERPSG